MTCTQPMRPRRFGQGLIRLPRHLLHLWESQVPLSVITLPPGRLTHPVWIHPPSRCSRRHFHILLLAPMVLPC